MIFGKLWAAFRAQLNKLANVFFEADPVAQMRYEYDRSVEQLKEGRGGLEMYRALVEIVTRQVKTNEGHVTKLEAQTKAYLKTGDRETAAKFALELEKARTELKQNQQQLAMHEGSYENNLQKIQNAMKKLGDVRNRIDKQEADLKMSEAEAEVAKLAEQFNFNVTTDFGKLEDVMQKKIDLNRAAVRVSADMSQEGIASIEAEERMEGQMAEDALKRMEVEMGIRTPETSQSAPAEKQLGPAQTN